MSTFQITAGVDPTTNTPVRLSLTRDIAHMFPSLLNMALSRFQGGGLDDPWIQAFRERHAITNEDLAEGIRALAAAVPAFARSQMASSLFECLEKSGYTQVREPVQSLLMAQLGAVVMGWYYQGVRECYSTSEECPVVEREARLAATVSDLLNSLTRNPLP